MFSINALRHKSIFTSDDTLSVSLLTVSKGENIYEKFGHTGIRISVPSKKFDAVYHYGLFSFEEPHFIYRFIKGETNYMIGAMSYYDFMLMYAIRGSSVRELRLNLTNREANSLFYALCENLRPENQTYRYSFLYDNCATRPLEIIFRNIEGELVVPQNNETLPTFRDLIHESTGKDSWATFGIDMLLDGETDSHIEIPDKPFLPHITERVFANAKIQEEGNDTLRALALTPPIEILKAREMEPESDIFKIFTPLFTTTLLLIVVIVISLFEIRKVKHNRILDTIVAILLGIFGIVIYFLLFFSEHPAVSANYNAFWLQPVWLLILPLIWTQRGKKFLYCYHFINFALLMLFATLMFFIKQNINVAFIPLILISIIRSITYIIVEVIKKRQNVIEGQDE
ncbi:MAG: DUF4105 domain-containing protein [Bacteroidales bacterium]|nr:DUF4105 domain-containing protein [Bacteroidales bacterium]